MRKGSIFEASIKRSNIEKIRNNPKNIRKIDKEFKRNNPDIYFKLLDIDPGGLRFLTEEEKLENPEVCEKALEIKLENIIYLPEEMQLERADLCEKAVKEIKDIYSLLSIEVLMQYPEITYEALLRDSYYVEDVPEELIESNRCVKEMIDLIQEKIDPKKIPDDILRECPQLCIKAIIKAYTNRVSRKEEIFVPSEEVLKDNVELIDKCLEEGWIGETYIFKMVKKAKSKNVLQRFVKQKDKSMSSYKDSMIELLETIFEKDAKDILEDLLSDKNEYNLDFDEDELTMLTLTVKDEDWYKKLVINNDQFKQVLTKENFANIVNATRDRKFIKNIIESEDNVGLNLRKEDIIYLVQGIRENEFIENMIENKNKYKFEHNDIVKLLGMIDSADFVFKFLEDHEEEFSEKEDKVMALSSISISDMEDKINKNYVDENTMKIKAPEGMTIGIEIESQVEYFFEELLNEEKVLGNWETCDEGSVEAGVEITSPILRSNNNSESEIYKAFELLEMCGSNYTDECGGHIHIGADYIKDVLAMKILNEIWLNSENILYLISNEEGELPREGIRQYGSPLSPDVSEGVQEGEIDLDNEDDLDKFVDEFKNIQRQGKDRYYSINFFNFGNKEKNTIESRIANEPKTPEGWIKNINLFTGIVKTAQELSDILKKPETELTEVDMEKLKLFEKIRYSKNDAEVENEQKKAESLINLVVSEEDRQIYLDRYKTNKKLMNGKNIVIGYGPIFLIKDLKKFAFEEAQEPKEIHKEAYQRLESDMDEIIGIDAR